MQKYLFLSSVLFIFIKNIFPEVPDGQERESNEETQRSSHLGYEGEGGVSPNLLFQPDHCVVKTSEKREGARQTIFIE